MGGCVILVKLSIACIVLTVTHEYQRARNDLKRNVYEVKRQAVYNTSFLQEEQWLHRLQHWPKGFTRKEMIKPDPFMSKGIGSMGNVKLTDGKLGNIGRTRDKVVLKMPSVPFKNEQNLHKVSERVRKDIKTENYTVTEQKVQCEVASLSCRNCCENSTNCSHKIAFCRCDPQCAFYNDCCVDYETFCGKKQNISLGIDQQGLSCMKPKYIDMKNKYTAVWIINQCPRNRERDNISQNCEISDELEMNITNIRYLIPVLGKNNLIFRNEFCAKCNSIEQFDYFGFNITCHVVPPASITSLAELVEFASRYCESKAGISVFRKDYQPVRDCNQYFRDICPTLKEMNETCGGYHFDVYSCTSQRIWCNINRSKWDDVFDIYDKCKDSYTVFKSIRIQSIGQVFGPVVPEQKILYVRLDQFMSPVKENIDIFEVVIWLDVGHVSDRWPTLNETISSLAQLFNFKRSQVSELRSTPALSIYTLIILFKLALTNEQTLRLGRRDYTKMNDAVSRFGNNTRNLMNGPSLHKLLFFSGKFNITVSNNTFTVFKTISRQLACIRKQTYSQGNYTSLQNGEYYINSTGETFAKNQVFFEESLNKSISVCELIVSSTCVGRRIHLTSEEYVKFDNLSIFYNRTKTIYDFGDYDIEDGNIFVCIPLDPRTQFSNSFVIQAYLTLICFVLSLTCLSLVVLTYLIFPELRNLPGKNLLSLSVSLFLTQLLWLIPVFPDSSYTSTPCHVAAVVKHYLFLVSFVAMATIAWDTYSVFASKDVRKSASEKRGENKKFFKYSAFVWGLPAMFVGACAVVDRTDIYAVYVNEQWCWLNNEDAQKYVFILPVGLLLLFNMILFVLTVIHIQHVRSNTRLIRSDQNPREMFWIYLKISALMGFSWLFGFVDFLVGTSTIVFSYLFVMFASLQGVYIALAFVVKRRIWEKYKKLFARKHKSRFKPDYQSTLLKDLSNTRETSV